MSLWGDRAEQEIDREDAEKRQRRINRRRAEIEMADRSGEVARRRDKAKAAEVAEMAEQNRKELVEYFGEIGNQINPLQSYHCLSIEGKHRCLLFSTWERLMEAQKIAAANGLGVDTWSDNVFMSARRLPNRIRAIAAVDPSDEEIRELGRAVSKPSVGL